MALGFTIIISLLLRTVTTAFFNKKVIADFFVSLDNNDWSYPLFRLYTFLAFLIMQIAMMLAVQHAINQRQEIHKFNLKMRPVSTQTVSLQDHRISHNSNNRKDNYSENDETDNNTTSTYMEMDAVTIRDYLADAENKRDEHDPLLFIQRTTSKFPSNN